ncbi:MAG: hypothetical protein HZA68_17455 [Rhodovulum sp.]|nr:hypothetical protein [Rhodovulum sp.]
MVIAPLVAASLALSVATGPLDPRPSHAASPRVALQSRVTATTDCIVRAIAADPRFKQASAGAMIGELIVDSMPACAATVREMIDAWDASFGDGSGEAFFMGPFLDVLPAAASRMLANDPAR